QQSREQRSRLQSISVIPFTGNISLIDRIIMPPYNLRGNSMNSFRNVRSQQSRGYFYPSFPDGKWSFGYLS
ncbi:hypothetical protein WUBG_14190, partial [Wuchereria bancrofti]